MPRVTNTAARHREAFARVLAAWAKDGRDHPGSRGSLAYYLDDMPVAYSTLRVLTRPLPVNMFDSRSWIVGRPVETHEGSLFPVASAAVKAQKGFMMGTVRVALFQGDTGSVVRASGLRFESAESVGTGTAAHKSPHTYPHSQPCRSWAIRGICLLHPDAQADPEIDGCPACSAQSSDFATVRTEHFNAQRPAVPLRCRTLPGLAVAALTSVYGAVTTREILEGDVMLVRPGCPMEVEEDIDHILGSDGGAGFPA